MTTADGSVIGEGGPAKVGALSTRRPRRYSAALGAALSGLGAEVLAQGARWVLWTPVAFGGGSASYFFLKAEPNARVGIGMGLAALFLLLSGRLLARWRGAAIAASLLAAAALGFADAKLATELARTPVVPEGIGVVEVAGRVVDIVDAGAERPRLLIAPTFIDGLPPDRLPARIRLSLKAPADLVPGDGVSARAILDPPPGPASPGGFDFARDAWFSRIGGVGLALSAPRRSELPPLGLRPADLGLRAEIALNAARWRLARSLAAALGEGEAAGLAVAVTTNHQAWLDASDADDLRASGLAHMLAIAGLHTAAVTGFVYAAVRLLVAAWPWLALRVSGKKLAAAAGLVACVVYLALSGAHPPARRAAVTAGVAFLAMLCDRRAISMRSLALAALIVLAFQPIAVVQPGFQMSFSATASLVAMAELWPRRSAARGLPWFLALPQHAKDWTLGMAAVSLVAGLATAPFALQHFNRMAMWGLPANFAADLLASLVLMPALVVSALGASVGLPAVALAVPLAVAGAAARAILAIAHLFATLPGAVQTQASAPQAALVIAFLGIVFACLWRGRLRWVAAPLAAAVWLWPRPPLPVAWIAADGDNAAIVVDGRTVALKPSVRVFAVNAWTTHRGLTAPFDPEAEAELAFDCDRHSCAPKPGAWPALGAWWSRNAVPPDRLRALCDASDILVVRGPEPAADSCPHALLLTRGDFDRGGSAEIFPGEGGRWRIAWAQTLRGERPWSVASTLAPPPPRRPVQASSPASEDPSRGQAAATDLSRNAGEPSGSGG